MAHSGIVMYPLGLYSLISITTLLGLFWLFRQADRAPDVVLRQAQAALQAGGKVFTSTAGW